MMDQRKNKEQCPIMESGKGRLIGKRMVRWCGYKGFCNL